MNRSKNNSKMQEGPSRQRIILPPKPKPSFFDDLHCVGFTKLLANFLSLLVLIFFVWAIVDFVSYQITGDEVDASDCNPPCVRKPIPPTPPKPGQPPRKPPPPHRAPTPKQHPKKSTTVRMSGSRCCLPGHGEKEAQSESWLRYLFYGR